MAGQEQHIPKYEIQSYGVWLTLEPPSSASFTSVASQIETVPRSSSEATFYAQCESNTGGTQTV